MHVKRISILTNYKQGIDILYKASNLKLHILVFLQLIFFASKYRITYEHKNYANPFSITLYFLTFLMNFEENKTKDMYFRH